MYKLIVWNNIRFIMWKIIIKEQYVAFKKMQNNINFSDWDNKIKTHTYAIETIIKSNNQIVETESKSTPPTHIYIYR
jgi:hypothetical protein